jgi:hypothetical protein
MKQDLNLAFVEGESSLADYFTLMNTTEKYPTNKSGLKITLMISFR